MTDYVDLEKRLREACLCIETHEPLDPGQYAAVSVEEAVEAADAIAALRRQKDETKAYLRAFVYATCDTDEDGNSVSLHVVNPTMAFCFMLTDDDIRPDRVVLGGQVRRAMEIVGFDALKEKPPAQTVAQELAEGRAAQAELSRLREERDRMRIALEPFCHVETNLDSSLEDHESIDVYDGLTAGHLRAARRAYEGGEP